MIVYLQAVLDHVLTMCKLSSDDVITLIGKHGRIGTFDVNRHTALWTQTIQVRSNADKVFSFTFTFTFGFGFEQHACTELLYSVQANRN